MLLLLLLLLKIKGVCAPAFNMMVPNELTITAGATAGLLYAGWRVIQRFLGA